MTNEGREGEERRQRRLQQLRQAQQDRRERALLEGKVLLQGLVDERVKREYRKLKGAWNMDSMGEEQWQVASSKDRKAMVVGPICSRGQRL